MKQNINILGSTGSIGETTLKIINKEKNKFKINILVSDKNYKKIRLQIKKFKPKIFIINNKYVFKKIKKLFKRTKVKIYNNHNFVKKEKKADITVSAIPGIAGLLPTIQYAKKSKKILLANKESVICGWRILSKVLKKNRTKLIPIDSEHYSIKKLLEGDEKNYIKNIYITASGGPFFNKKKTKKITPKLALNHPKWNMGKKISIDSATMMNKLFELIEAQKLFEKYKNKIKIIIHPQSLIHAIIEYENGLSKFLFHQPNMIIPISNALLDNNLDIKKFLIKRKKQNFKKLDFFEINKNNFPPLQILPILNRYESLPIIINAANEILVDQFLRKKISFKGIMKLLLSVLKDKNFKKYAIQIPQNINIINNIDRWSRETTLGLIKKKYAKNN